MAAVFSKPLIGFDIVTDDVWVETEWIVELGAVALEPASSAVVVWLKFES
jgi:hypothetical protein